MLRVEFRKHQWTHKSMLNSDAGWQPLENQNTQIRLRQKLVRVLVLAYLLLLPRREIGHCYIVLGQTW